MITFFPASPKTFSPMIEFTASVASFAFLAMITPLPPAKPSAFTTQEPPISFIYSRASSALSKTLKPAVGTLYFAISSLAKTLLDSNCAAGLFGPNILRSYLLNSSTIPRDNGTSGPTTVRSIFSLLAKSKRPWISSALISMHSAVCAIPPLPGAQNILSANFDLETEHTRACSLPPDPTTRIFINAITSPYPP